MSSKNNPEYETQTETDEVDFLSLISGFVYKQLASGVDALREMFFDIYAIVCN